MGRKSVNCAEQSGGGLHTLLSIYRAGLHLQHRFLRELSPAGHACEILSPWLTRQHQVLLCCVRRPSLCVRAKQREQDTEMVRFGGNVILSYDHASYNNNKIAFDLR